MLKLGLVSALVRFPFASRRFDASPQYLPASGRGRKRGVKHANDDWNYEK